MSKELTEKWKNGSLSYGYYYIKEDEDADIEIAFYDQDGDLVGLGERYVPYKHEKLEIIEKVPTYEEYLESEAHCAVYSEINKDLKERLEIARKKRFTMGTLSYVNRLLRSELASLKWSKEYCEKDGSPTAHLKPRIAKTEKAIKEITQYINYRNGNTLPD